MPSPSYQSALIERMFVMRWRARPASGDILAIARDLADARRQIGAPLIQVELVGANVPRPSPAVMIETMRHVRVMRHLREQHYVVIEATGAEASLVRGVFTGVGLVLPDVPVFCASLDAALLQIGEQLRIAPSVLRAGVDAHGLAG